MRKNINEYNQPILFYSLVTIIPWLFWFGAGYISHLEPQTYFYKITYGWLGVFGLTSPAIIAMIMMCRKTHLKADLCGRVFSLSKTKPSYWFLTCFLMLGSIVIAQLISIAFGHGLEQFQFNQTSSFKYSLFPAWFMLILAPILEELAWHSYGTDCLRARFNLFVTSIIFSVFWVIWHMPLATIKDYYHANLAHSGLVYSLNFALSLFPFVILMNWLYYKTNRNILIAVIFHVTAGVFNELFKTHPDSKVIQTFLLLLLSIFILKKEKELFFKKEYEEI